MLSDERIHYVLRQYLDVTLVQASCIAHDLRLEAAAPAPSNEETEDAAYFMGHADGRTAASPAPAFDLEAFATLVWRNVCELPDRTSPEDDPEAAVCTFEELRGCIGTAMDEMSEDSVASPAQVAQQEPVMITKGERDGNWQEFDVNGHGGLIRVVARMEDDDADLPLGKLVESFLLATPPDSAETHEPIGYAWEELSQSCNEPGETWKLRLDEFEPHPEWENVRNVRKLFDHPAEGAQAGDAREIDAMVKRLRNHEVDKRNTAFARSTMMEVADWLAAMSREQQKAEGGGNGWVRAWRARSTGEKDNG